MSKEIRLTTLNDSIAIILDSSMALVARADENFSYTESDTEGEIHGSGGIVPTFTVELAAIEELKKLPFPLYLLERLNRVYGLTVLIFGILYANPKLIYLGFFCVLPFFKSFIRFVSLLINGSQKYRGLFKKGFQHRAACNQVVNALNDLGRIPTPKEAQEYDMTDKSGNTVEDHFIGFTYIILLPVILISPTSFITGFGFPILVAILFFGLYFLYTKGFFDKFENKLLEKPEGRDIALAIIAITMYASLTGDARVMNVEETDTPEETADQEQDK